jgi:hypothetical protein
MYILDTDHLTILQRGGQLAQQLKYKLADLDPNVVSLSFYSFLKLAKVLIKRIT